MNRTRCVWLPAFALLVAAACGRTPETRTAYPCFVDLTGDCDALAPISERLVYDYRQEVEKPEIDAQRADDIGACHRKVVEQQLTLRCIADRCAKLCAFHPCPVQENQTCDARCDAVIGEDAADTTPLEPGILTASEQPGFCSCTFCEGATKKVCDDVWVCP